jgi:hypothetical protein
MIIAIKVWKKENTSGVFLHSSSRKNENRVESFSTAVEVREIWYYNVNK